MKNMVRPRVSREVKLQFIKNCISVGFDFGGIVIDNSIKGIVEGTMICVDEGMNGYEIKMRSSQFCLYRIIKGRSQKGVWHNYSDVSITPEGDLSID